MQNRIRHLSRAAHETVQRAMHAFAAPIENMSIDHVVISDSVPVSALKMASTSENLRSWVGMSGCSRYWKYIRQKSDLQEKSFFPEDTFTQIEGFVVQTEGFAVWSATLALRIT